MRCVCVSITRGELVRIVAAASEGCTYSSRLKFVFAAQRAGKTAVGWFHCDGVACLAVQAGRRNQKFQESFDRLMWARFPSLSEKVFVAEVVPGEA